MMATYLYSYRTLYAYLTTYWPRNYALYTRIVHVYPEDTATYKREDNKYSLYEVWHIPLKTLPLVWRGFMETVNRTCHLPRLLHAFVPLILRCWTIYFKSLLPVIMYRHDTCHISTTITVIGSRPNSDELRVEHVLVAFLDQLVRTSDQRKTIDVVEL